METYIGQLRAAGTDAFKDEWELMDAVGMAKQNILSMRKTITPALSAQIAAIFADTHLNNEVRRAAVEILTSLQQYVPAAVSPAIKGTILDPKAPLSLITAATEYIALYSANNSAEVLPHVTEAFASVPQTASEEVLLRLAILGRDVLRSAFSSDLLSSLERVLPSGLLQSEDPAIVLNALELFDGDRWPAHTPEMFGFFEACVGAIGKLIAKSKGDALFEALLVPAALRGLANVIGMDPEGLSAVAEKAGLLNTVAGMFDEWCVRTNRRNDIAAGCIECVGKIGSSAAGMAALERVAPGIFGSLGSIAVSGAVQDTRLMAQHVLGEMLMSDDRAAISGSCEALVFRKFTPSPRAALAALRRSAEEPIEDTSCAALHLIQGLAHHEWGLRALAAQGGMLESLTNTQAVPYGMEPRTASRLREWRHATVRSILLCFPREKVTDIIGPEMYIKLKGFLTLGPQYVQPSVIVGDSTH